MIVKGKFVPSGVMHPGDRFKKGKTADQTYFVRGYGYIHYGIICETCLYPLVRHADNGKYVYCIQNDGTEKVPRAYIFKINDLKIL